MSTRIPRSPIRLMAAMCAALALAGLSPGLASAAPLPVSFDLYIGNPCVRVIGSEGKALQLIWRDAGGALKAQHTIRAGFSYRSYCSTDPQIVVAVGDRIKVKHASKVHKLVVPNLAINLNRVTDRLKGFAPAGQRVRIECQSADPFRHFEPCIWQRNVTAGADGTWAVSVPFDFIGGAEMALLWTGSGGDEVRAWGTAPFVNVTLGRSGFSGATRPNRTASVDLDQKAHGTAVGDPFQGRFRGQFLNDSAHTTSVAPGDSLTADIAMDAAWVVPAIDASVSAASDVVSGRCHDTGASSELVNVLLYRSGNQRGWALQDTEPDGSFSFNFLTGDGDFWTNVNVRTGDKLVVRCMQAEGDWVQRVIFAAAES